MMVSAVIQPQTHSLLVCTTFDVWLAENDKVYVYVTGPVGFPKKKKRGEIKPEAGRKTAC